MPGDYIPATDAGLRAWAANFNTHATATPLVYGFTAPMATAYDALFTDYDAWLLAADDPAQRTPVVIASKDAARALLVEESRDMAAIAQAFPAITPALLTELGLTVRLDTRTPFPAPTAIPELAVQLLAPLQVKLRIKQIGSLLSPYPVGAPLCEIWYKTGDVAPVDLTGCSFAGDATRRFFMHDLPGAMGGDKVHYIARYKTRPGLTGSLSSTLSTTIPY